MEVVVTWPAWIAAGRSGILRRRLPPAGSFLGLPSPPGVGEENPRLLPRLALASKLLTHTSLKNPNPSASYLLAASKQKTPPLPSSP
jgi:hypothetical protein